MCSVHLGCSGSNNNTIPLNPLDFYTLLPAFVHKTELGRGGGPGALQLGPGVGGRRSRMFAGSCLSCVVPLSVHLLFASHFLVIAMSIARIFRDNGNNVEKGFPQLRS